MTEPQPVQLRPDQKVRAVVETRVRTVPVTEYAIRFHCGDVSPRTYTGRPADGGPAYAPNADGFARDGFQQANYIGWEESRTVYVIDPDPWEVVGPQRPDADAAQEG